MEHAREGEPISTDGPARMNPEVKRRWVQALRSGRYTQGTGRLRSVADEFCCLGVLCDLKDPDGWRWNNDGRSWHYGDDFDIESDVGLPPEVVAWAGLADHDFPTSPEVRGAQLAEWNDGRTDDHDYHHPQLTLSEIADLIEHSNL